jgi:ribosomal protein S12 methylthiotransferase
MRFKIVSLGCPKNLVDSEYIAHRLEQGGHTLNDDADLVVINTCAFVEDATKESIDVILSEAGADEGKGRKIVVAGCLVERYKEELAKLLPEVDLFLPRSAYGRIEKLVSGEAVDQASGEPPCFPRKVFTRLPSAYIKIQEGCDNRCSYCTIPAIRGPLTSRGTAEIVEEFSWLLQEGYREFTVIGQDVTAYGRDTGSDIKRLLGALLSVHGDYFLRLLYLHPRGIDDELIALIAGEDRIIKYLDIPVQHSEDTMLRAMNRGYTRAHLEDLLGRIRSAIPGIVLRTTLMVGFPGETDQDFANLCDFVRTWKFDNLGAFVYSKEEGTPAFCLKGHVKKGLKRERFQRIMEIQKDISMRKLEQFIGKRMKFVVEQREGERMVGRLLIQAPDVDGVAFIDGACKEGEIREGVVVKTLDYDVIVRV